MIKKPRKKSVTLSVTCGQFTLIIMHTLAISQSCNFESTFSPPKKDYIQKIQKKKKKII